MNIENLNDIKIVPLLDTLRLQKIDDEEYFSVKYSNYISNSRLSLLNPAQDNDPEAFFEGLSKHNKYSDSLLFGSTIHQLLLQPESFYLCESVKRPTAKLGFMADELYKVYLKNKQVTYDDVIKASDTVNYYKGRLNDEKVDIILTSCRPYWSQREKVETFAISTPICLDPKSQERVKCCMDALARDFRIIKLLNPIGIANNPESENEQTILLDVQMIVPDYEPFVFKLKAKIDNYTIDTETDTVTVNDLKTIGKVLSAFKENFDKFRYARELSIYTWLMSLVAKKYYNMDNVTIKSNCLVVSTIPQYYTKVYPLSKTDFIEGWNEFKYLLRLAAYYYSEGYRFE